MVEGEPAFTVEGKDQVYHGRQDADELDLGFLESLFCLPVLGDVVARASHAS
jgi:hypothetical protein